MLKWLLRWYKSDSNSEVQSLTSPYEGDRGIRDLHDNDAELRLWLPEPLRLALNQTTRELQTTESKYLREFLTVYLYGVHEILRMNANKTGLYFVPPPPPPDPDADSIPKPLCLKLFLGLAKTLLPANYDYLPK
jgi:hypothetical protein